MGYPIGADTIGQNAAFEAGYDAGFDAAMETIEDEVEVEVEPEGYDEGVAEGFEDGYQTALADVHSLIVTSQEGGCNCDQIVQLEEQVEALML